MFLKARLIIMWCTALSSLHSFEILRHCEATHSLGYGDCALGQNGEWSLLQKILKPESLIFDVGANVGEWSQTALRIQPTIRLISFEPVPSIFEQLKHNLRECANAQVRNFALSDERGPCTFYYYSERPDLTGLSGLYLREVLKGVILDPEVLNLRQETLTHFCAEESIEKIDFLKIDTEGAEWKVLQGAEALLKEKRITAIQFEYGGTYNDAKITLEQIVRLLTSDGYLVFRIVPDGLVHIAKWESSLENYQYCNYFALLKEAFVHYFPSHTLDGEL